MILVLASLNDWPARALVRRWETHGAKLLTCRDLSTPGWRYYPGDPAASCAVVGSQQVAFVEIDVRRVETGNLVRSSFRRMRAQGPPARGG